MTQKLDLSSLIRSIADFTQRDVSEINEDTVLRNLVIESFVLVEMIIELQDQFDVRLNGEDLADVKTVSELLSVMESIKR